MAEKIGIVTGSSSGMGREFVKAIDRDYGLDGIWVIARRKERLEELASECSTPLRVIACDLQKKESILTIEKMLSEESPDVRILVNGAGFGAFGEFGSINPDTYSDMIDLNCKALTAMTYSVLPYMGEGSALVNICSNSSWQPVPYIGVYGATKAYALSFTRALYSELKCAKRKMTVTAVCPGWIKTEFFDRAVRDDTIKYYDRFYTAEQVVDRAMRDIKKKKLVSIMGFPVRMQVRLIKFLPVKMVMNIWCRQQGKL